MPFFADPPRRGKRPDPIAALFTEERNVVLSVAAEQRLPSQDHGDLMNSTLVAVLSHVARGRFVMLDDAEAMRATVRAYLCTTARRIVWEHRHRERMERDAREPLMSFDPMPRFEARSDLRALDLSPVAVAFFQAIVHEGSVLARRRSSDGARGPRTPAETRSGRMLSRLCAASGVRGDARRRPRHD